MKILALSGSLRRESFNTALARAAGELAPDGVEVEIYDGLGLLPHYDQDLDHEDVETPEPVADLRRRIEEADALLVITPEYNGTLPSVLKNAIDWASARHRGSWLRNKTVAIAGATTGQYGAIWAQQDAKRVLGIAGARVVGGELEAVGDQLAWASHDGGHREEDHRQDDVLHAGERRQPGHGEVDQLRLDLGLGQPGRRGHPLQAGEPDAAEGVEGQQVGAGGVGRGGPGHAPAPRRRATSEPPAAAAA
jgi:chromate reductase